MNRISRHLYGNGWIILICVLSFLLRIKGLNYQSLWLDELHTMNEADPSHPWAELFFYLKCCDQHPCLYFIIEKIAFNISGYTGFVARFVSVIAGTISVWAMYSLGKEALNKSLGVICAILTAINFYDLSYSQEARPYIFAFLFAAVSFTWFMKLVKSPSRKTVIGYSIFTLLLLYSHYYSLFVVAAQSILALIFVFQETRPGRKKLFNHFLLCALIIVIGYAPWLSFLQAMIQIKSFWVPDIPPSFLKEFFYGYFGNDRLLQPLLLILLVTFVVRVFMKSDIPSIKKVKENPLLFNFIIILIWVSSVILIPYVRSRLVVPMLLPRYTIVLLPAIILALSYSIELFKIPLLKYSITVLFVVLSVIHLFFEKKYYTKITKTQFREMTQYVVRENTSNFPIINQLTAWHQAYYLKLFSSKAEVRIGKKDDLVDSILLKRSKGEDLKGFWIVGAHRDPMLTDSMRKLLDSAYMLIKQKTFYEAWAQLYISKTNMYRDDFFIGFNDFNVGEGTILPGQNRIAIWGGAIHSKPVYLKRGKYKMTISAMGTKAADQYPHVNIYSNGHKIADYYVSEKMEERDIEFENSSDASIVFTVEMDNDFYSPSSKADRNLFLKGIGLQLNKN